MATATLTPTTPQAVEYPTRDGKPMAETDKHAELMIYVREALKVHFNKRANVYVSGNNFVYWQEGNSEARISPDAYVVFGPQQRFRDFYKSWEEGGYLPNVIFEFTSPGTKREDTDRKLPLYEQTLRTPEYFLFDPTGSYLRPRLQGYRLQLDGRYARMRSVSGRLHSEQLGLDLVQDGEMLRLYDPIEDKFLPTAQEQADLIREQAELLAAEARRAEEQARRADEQARRADEQARRADEQARRADASDAEMARLRAELEALRGPH